MSNNPSENQPLLENDQDIQEPKLYKVIMHNDNITILLCKFLLMFSIKVWKTLLKL